MPKITDAQVEVAESAHDAVLASHQGDLRDAEKAAMRAALEAYERVRDLESIYTPTAQQRAENDARVEESLESLRHKVKEGYQR